MVKVKYKEVYKECRCSSCNKDVFKEEYKENFKITIGELNIELCIDCANDLGGDIFDVWAKGCK